ncbi:MAG: DNA-3-methyladenine glycosylase [Thermoleophilia bacterium]
MKVAAVPAAPAPVPGAPLDRDFFSRDAVEVARDLVGCELIHEGVGGTIVETEAYREDDPASHSSRGPRGRAAVMFGPPGRLYVYRSYGMHWCVNLVCEPEGRGAAVLIRALEPTRGLDAMRARRGDGRPLAAGPGRLTQALAIDGTHNGRSAVGPDAVVALAGRGETPPLVSGPRIGISVAREVPWRFGHAGSPHLSRPFPPGDAP